MNAPHVYFRVQLGRWPDDRHDFSFVIPISEIAVGDYLRPIDEPDPPFVACRDVADAVLALVFCTPPDVIKQVKAGRERIAKEIAAAFLREIDEHDKRNGYTREQDREFYGPQGKRS